MRMEQEYNCNICVIGGGPAGSVIAKQLANLNHNVILVEKATFPRSHVGICLSDTTKALLNYLNVGPAIEEAKFWKRSETLVQWNTSEPIKANQPGMHVDRGVFDQILLEAAKKSGVRTLESTRVVSVKHMQRGGWRLKVSTDGKSAHINTFFLVDASGRANVLSQKSKRYAPPLFSLHANWELASDPQYDGLMESGTSSWLWVANLGKRQAMISVYVDPKKLAQSKLELSEYYLLQLKQFKGLEHFEYEQLLGEVKGCDASSRYSPDPVGADYIRVGDACLCVDPMASQGVHLAISSSIQAATVVNTLIRYPENREMALKFYRESQQSRIKQFVERTAFEYARAGEYWTGPFWAERGKDAPKNPEPEKVRIGNPHANWIIQLSPKSHFVSTPVLKETLVDEQLALCHPGLDRPVAYLGDQLIVPLLKGIKPEQTAGDILAEWEKSLPKGLSSQIFGWLWQHEILVSNQSVS